MGSPLSKWDFEHWWKLLGAAGALIGAASAPPVFVPGVLIGLGLLFFGIGEWINHPIQMKRSGGVITESYPWRFNSFGLVLDLIGVGLFGFGLFRLLAFGP